jgi:hypothetical protein
MKNFTLILVLFLASIQLTFSQTETCDCKTDLDFIVEKIKAMPSFKTQIKDEKATQFENTYTNLSNQMKQPILIEDCYKMLLQQMVLVNDVHASLNYTKTPINKEDLKDTLKLNDFKASNAFKKHPKTEYNLNDLEAELSKKNDKEIEGVYNYGDDLKIGIYQQKESDTLVGVVLKSNLNQWDAGQIIIYATHTAGIKYNLFYYTPSTRTPGFVKSISFENGRLWIYKKVSNTNNEELPIKDQSNWEFRQLTPNTQYLYFGNFSSFSKSNRKAFKDFYAKVKKELSATNVIVDLRSNAGGNSKLSDPFLKLLKKKNVYILTNCFTGSNGEQFTLKLKVLKNAKHLGQTTRGIIAYGMNYGYNYNTPSGNFNITPTDMNFNKYIAYEGKGVTPEFALDFGKDWLEQTLAIIKNTSN